MPGFSCYGIVLLMRLILDTNQVAELTRPCRLTPQQKRETTLVLPPLVWAEYLLRAHPQRGVMALAQYNVRFGIDVWEALDAVRTLTDAQIRRYEPIVAKKSNAHKKLLADLVNCDPIRIAVAQEIAAQTKLDNAEIATTVRANAKKERDARSRGESVAVIEDIKDINECLRVSRDALVAPGGSMRGTESASAGSSSAPESFQALPEAVLDNRYISRFLRIFSAQISAYEDMWENKAFNITASENRNDFTDISLALYANDGDIILSNDRKFRRLFEHCEPQQWVRVMTWHQYLTSVVRSKASWSSSASSRAP